MCGIVGLFNYAGSESTVSESILQSMTDRIAHRGPDDIGYYIAPDRKVGLGFRRLSIVDLSPAGHQPMQSNDGSIHIVFNGEVYNHADIRATLLERGYRYHSRTDTETILYAYQEFGLDFVHRLYGMFAIALWDSVKRRMILVRDRIGIKPVYYTIRNGCLLFASEIKALLQHPLVTPELHEQGLYDYLTLLTTPPDETMFKGIFKLPAGHTLSIDETGNVQIQRYWNLDHVTEEFPAASFKNEAFCIENIRRLLRDSIKLRMMADVPFGVLLSGGIDSSLNVALMSELMDRPVETFSVGYRDLERYNELQYARQISERFKTSHHEIFLEESNLIDFLPDMVWHLDEPNADPVCVPMYYVSKLARQSGTIVVQVGEGSDEQFAGYHHYLRELRFHKFYDRIFPQFIKKINYAAIRQLKPHSLLSDYARRSASQDAIFYGGALNFSEEMKNYLLTNQFRSRMESTGRIPLHYFAEFQSMVSHKPGMNSYMSQMIYFEFKSRLAELLLMRVDKMSMATSIEARVPFLDHRLVEFSSRIPEGMKTRGGITKYILKKAAEGIIPDNIIYRKKQGFAAPVTEWLRSGNLSHYAHERISNSPLLRNNELFNYPFIDSLFTEHRNGKANYSGLIWNLLVLALWHERYFTQQ